MQRKNVKIGFSPHILPNLGQKNRSYTVSLKFRQIDHLAVILSIIKQKLSTMKI